MKKKVILFIDIDTHRDSPSGVRSGAPNRAMEALVHSNVISTYTMILNGNTSDPRDPQISLEDTMAHELGHMLSSILDLPGGMNNDPRNRHEFVSSLDAAYPRMEQADRILSNETLAWSLAQKIRPDLDRDAAQRALATYQDGMYARAAQREEIESEIAAEAEAIQRWVLK